MSRKRARRNRSSGNDRGASNSSNNNNRRSRRRRRRRGGDERSSKVGFWGSAGQLPPPRADVRITDDPTAAVRSLGPPPLPGREEIATHYHEVIYSRVVTIAGALAAAGGMIEPDELTEGLDDDEE